MKKFLSLTMVLALFAACSDKGEEKEPVSVAVSSVTLSAVQLELGVGESQTLQATVYPDNASNKTLTWSSSKPDVATVSGGTVTAVSAGTSVVTARAGEKSATCKVVVAAPPLPAESGIGELSSDSPIIHGNGGKDVLSITALEKWSVSSSESWLKASPSSGKAGDVDITLTTEENTTETIRVASLMVKIGQKEYDLSIMQRPNIFSRREVASGTVSNKVTVSYSSAVVWDRIYVLLPVPETNQYQDISAFSCSSASIQQASNNGNKYAVADISSSFPASGGSVVEESFQATSYEVTANLELMDNIPEYDPESEVCKKYLVKNEAGGLVSTTHADIARVADALWNSTEGDLIAYAKGCYEWTASNLTYGNMNTGLHPITDLMKSRTGDCGNYSSVFISLLRAKGIPARHVVMISPNEQGYHVRAEFYIPAYGWIPADPTFKNSNPSGNYFGVFTAPYVVVSFGINSTCKGYTGSNYNVDLLQAYSLWYWVKINGTINFSHKFSRFQ